MTWYPPRMVALSWGALLALLALTAACGDLASVPYNAMLRQLSTRETAGRISGLGWAAGYTGSVLILLLIYAPKGLAGLGNLMSRGGKA